jgi:hypothetical protein
MIMSDKKKKKLRAAIAGVMAHIEQEENDKKKTNNWRFSGRKIIMKNNQLVQNRILERV